MFRLTHGLPKYFWVAVSGGVDSMVALRFFRYHKGLLGVLHFNHNTGAFADSSEKLVREVCAAENITLRVTRFDGRIEKGESKESVWREARYKWFDSISNEDSSKVVIAHHFDDCLEEYLMCTMVRGYIGTIPYSRGNCVRPFRTWKKSSMIQYAKGNGLTWIDDPTNSDTNYKRNFIRNEIVPKALELNPGLYSMVEAAIRHQDKFSGV